MKKQLGVISVITLFVVTLFTLSAFATDAQMYFSSDTNGQNRVTNIQEGDEIWIVVIDNDENIDCDVRDKIWTDIKLMDPKTGAYIVWISYLIEDEDAGGKAYTDPAYVPYKGHYPGTPGWMGNDYLEETGADTGVFVSKRAFKVGTRENFDTKNLSTHVVDLPNAAGVLADFQWGGYTYLDDAPATNPPYFADDRVYLKSGPTFGTGYLGVGDIADRPSEWLTQVTEYGEYLAGRFENMDTLIGLYQDRNDATDVAMGMMKIIDTEATITWDQQIYKDANGSATITVVDPDENLNCNEVEYVPVFILVNPGSWNPQTGSISPTNFCMLLRTGGVDPSDGSVYEQPIRWYNIYSGSWETTTNATYPEFLYYMEYDQTLFNTVNPYTPVLFYAQETGQSTGVFQLNINQILDDLKF
ncbi:hypothetical protein ACFLS0_02920, partial [Candidatus Bipolaricaulota bacterium]